jgi:hypothetical protein
MSHKQKNHRQTTADPQAAESVVEARPSPKPLQEVQKTPTAKPKGEDMGLTWQPAFVLGLIVIGVLVLLAKVLKLF